MNSKSFKLRYIAAPTVLALVILMISSTSHASQCSGTDFTQATAIAYISHEQVGGLSINAMNNFISGLNGDKGFPIKDQTKTVSIIDPDNPLDPKINAELNLKEPKITHLKGSNFVNIRCPAGAPSTTICYSTTINAMKLNSKLGVKRISSKPILEESDWTLEIPEDGNKKKPTVVVALTNDNGSLKLNSKYSSIDMPVGSFSANSKNTKNQTGVLNQIQCAMQLASAGATPACDPAHNKLSETDQSIVNGINEQIKDMMAENIVPAIAKKANEAIDGWKKSFLTETLEVTGANTSKSGSTNNYELMTSLKLLDANEGLEAALKVCSGNCLAFSALETDVLAEKLKNECRSADKCSTGRDCKAHAGTAVSLDALNTALRLASNAGKFDGCQATNEWDETWNGAWAKIGYGANTQTIDCKKAENSARADKLGWNKTKFTFSKNSPLQLGVDANQQITVDLSGLTAIWDPEGYRATWCHNQDKVMNANHRKLKINFDGTEPNIKILDTDKSPLTICGKDISAEIEKNIAGIFNKSGSGPRITSQDAPLVSRLGWGFNPVKLTGSSSPKALFMCGNISCPPIPQKGGQDACLAK
jgi:hypothetical protein